jgi:hypothetical protein
MKTHTLYRRMMLGLAALALLAGCDKQVKEYAPAPTARTAVDANGGSWKTILIGSPAGIQIGAPTAPNSGEYAAELAALKSAMAGATDAQKNAAGYWSAGGVLRWNQVARELVAKYNLAPVNNEDNTYPVPDQNNPTAYPKFPFANPPYASRAYALLSVVQYDALVAAWHYKYQFNRPAPYAVDGSIKPLHGGSELPAYPSEDAVVAAASAEVLKFLFPGDVEMLADKAREHADSRLWAGTNVQSDLDAGAAIGRAVAQKVLAHARADGMRTAGGADWKAMEAACVARGEMPWKSMDAPARPPMLPGFGLLKTWNFGAA